jgi:hypothetical protein
MPSKNPAQRRQDMSTTSTPRELSWVEGRSMISLAISRPDMRWNGLWRSSRKLHAVSPKTSESVIHRLIGAPSPDWNVHRHDYDLIDANLMWESIEQRLGPLRAVVEEELQRLGGR